MRFEPPSIRERGQVAQAMAEVQQHKPAHGEAKGIVPCPRCRGPLRFTIFANGTSMGYCPSAGCVRWQ
jgi:hypothetical protein